jgi:uncharacterized glyoxalase superfamily protein PhnB
MSKRWWFGLFHRRHIDGFADWLSSFAAATLEMRKEVAMLKQAIPNIFVKDFRAALAYYTGPLGFHSLFVYGEPSFYAHVARDEAILAVRHVAKPVIDHAAGEDLLSAFVEVSDVDALYVSLNAAGARIRQAPRDEPWAMRSLIVSDLDDNLICFASSLSG